MLPEAQRRQRAPGSRPGVPWEGLGPGMGPRRLQVLRQRPSVPPSGHQFRRVHFVSSWGRNRRRICALFCVYVKHQKGRKTEVILSTLTNIGYGKSRRPRGRQQLTALPLGHEVADINLQVPVCTETDFRRRSSLAFGSHLESLCFTSLCFSVWVCIFAQRISEHGCYFFLIFLN